MLYFDRIGVSKGLGAKQIHQKKAIFVVVFFFLDLGLGFKCMSEIDIMIY